MAASTRPAVPQASPFFRRYGDGAHDQCLMLVLLSTTSPSRRKKNLIGKHSIVDLMKLLDLAAARRPQGSCRNQLHWRDQRIPTMNIW